MSQGRKISTRAKAMKVPSHSLPLHFSSRPLLLLIVTLTLADLRPGESGIVAGLDLPLEDADRLMALGFIPGVRVSVARAAPGGDPVVFRVDGTEVALRRETARRLTLHPVRPMTATAPPVGKPLVVALVGPPNSGKSTLFNRLTGLHQKVANYPGVTVEQRRGRLLDPGPARSSWWTCRAPTRSTRGRTTSGSPPTC